MKIHYKKSDTFVPEWNDNKSLPEKDQVKFHHRFLTTEERSRFVYWEPYTEGQVAKLMAIGSIDKMDEAEAEKAISRADRKYIQDSKGIAKTITTGIDNLILKDDEDGTEYTIDTIDKFYKAVDACPALRAEYEQYCLNLSAKVDSKN